MRKDIGCWAVLWTMGLLAAATGSAQEDVYYARCNLKVMDKNEITWVNWQAAPTFLPVGTKFRVTRKGSKATLVQVDTNASYDLDIGADGDAFLEKFVTKHAVSVEQFPEDVRQNIRNAVAKVGMTREQVYIAMGPPTNLGQTRTSNLTYDNIMASNLWVYARRRFAKNIGVAFDPVSGKVTRTEGIWGKD